jgi:pimeloyl-ACP methyl ester carboxylesterase
VLAIQGRQDQYGTLAQIAEIETRSYAPVETLILDPCRHAPHQDQPEAVLAAVAEFCARLERIEAAQPEG